MKSTFSFSKGQRLISATDYQYVFKKATRSSDKFLTIIARPSQANRNRLGLAISKKAIKLAVQRNRIKRLTREYFRLNHNSSKNIDFVVMAKKGADETSNQKIIESLHRNFSRLFNKF